MSEASGKLLKDRYLLQRLVGKGKMGSVYEAIDKVISDRKVAVKEFGLTDNNKQDYFIQSVFNRETKILSDVNHKWIPAIFDSFEQDGFGYIILEFAEGKDLETILNEKGNGLPEKEIVNILLKICDIIDFLHSRKNPVIYADLKPGNIIMDENGNIKLTDFSLSRFKDCSDTDVNSIIGGTIGFAPPEQFTAGNLPDESFDIFAMGGLIYYLAVGSNPPSEFSSSSDKLVKLPPKLSVKLSPSLKIIAERCLRIDKEVCYTSVKELRRDLLAVSSGKKIVRRQVSNTVQNIFAIAITITIVIISINFVYQRKNQNSNTSHEKVTVESITASWNAFDPKTDRIILKFSKPMNENSVKEALLVNCVPVKKLVWSENSTKLEILLTSDNIFVKHPIELKLDSRIAESKDKCELSNYNNKDFRTYGSFIAIIYGENNY